jgi:acyl dehydratase
LLDFDSAVEGTALAELSITESQDIINRRSAFRLAGRPNESNIHTDEEFARQNIFNGIVASGPAAMSYVDQMLQRSFPLSAFHHGGRLLMRAIEPFRVGDTVTLQGEVMAKQPALPSEGQGGGMVECRIKGINQRGDLVNLSDASLFLP